MTDIAADNLPPRSRSLDVTSAEAKARIRKRYRAENRFRLYGLSAIAFAGLFLLVLLGDILIKGLPAFWVHKLTMPVALAAETLDPGKTGDPKEIAKGDFAAVIRSALVEQFPEAKERAVRRQLTGLLSSGAADTLRAMAAETPSLVGNTVNAPLLLSDDADLYFKGVITTVETLKAQGSATPSGTEGTIEITSTSADFAPMLAAVKAALGEALDNARREAGKLDERIAGYDAAITRLTAEINETTGDRTILQQELDKAKADKESLVASRATLEQRIESLKARTASQASAETIDPTVPSLIVKINGGTVKVSSVAANRITGETLSPLSAAATAAPGAWTLIEIPLPEADRRLSDREILWLEEMRAKGQIENSFNWAFFTGGDSREPELAGILGGMIGSALTLIVTLLICLPLGVAAAIYLEEFAPKNRLTSLIEVNVNNLAAVPSIVFGLLGLAIFLNFFGMPRSSALVGGLVLALLVLPTIIIASRAALKAVPPSIREGALGVGASHQQAVFHHVLPLAMPGILTGTIIGMAHALGETAPLLMIGMIAFIVDVPTSFTQAATALPVQIFLWSDLPEVAFKAKTSAAIIVLLIFLFVMNGIAIFLRRRFERRW